VSAAARLLFGITDDDEDAIRTLSPPWSENSTYIHLRAPENGTYQYVDASYFSPYSYITDPLTAMLRGEDWQKALASTATELHKPWTGGSPLFSELLQAAVRSDDVANHENPYWRAVFRSITPGVVDQYARLATGRSMSGRDVDRAHEATALLTGFRGEKKDVREGLRIMSGGFNGRLGQQKGPLRRAKNREGFTGRIGEIRDIIFGEGSAMTALEKKTEESQIDVYAEMMQYVGAAMQIGVTERELRKILRDASISRKNTNIIIRGAYAGVRR
jgi:hypothetical protein